MREARRLVQEPPQPRVKLRGPAPNPQQKIRLNPPGQRHTGASGVSVDSESLKRQQDLVNAGANGRTPAAGNANDLVISHAATEQSKRSQNATENGIPIAKDRPRSDSAEHPKVNGVKKESALSQSPTLGAVHVNGDIRRSTARQSPSSGTTAMPPPLNNTSRMTSGSPLPQPPIINSHIPTSHAPATPFDNRWRPEGKGGLSMVDRNCNC